MGPSSVLRALPEFSLLLSDTVSENSHILFLALDCKHMYLKHVLKLLFTLKAYRAKNGKKYFKRSFGYNTNFILNFTIPGM
jgi:hypothetical protein